MYKGIKAIIPCAAGGFSANENMARIDITRLVKAENILFTADALRKAPGAAKFDSNAISGTPTLRAGIDWWPSSGVQRMVTAWSDGKLYKEQTGDVDNVTLKSGLSATAMGVFVEAGGESLGADRKLLFFNGYDAPQVLAADGATTADLATPPADWTGTSQPSGAAVHDGRLAAWGNLNFPHALYYSTVTDHEDFTGTGSGYFIIYPGDGERISAGVSFLQTRFYVFKYPRGIYYVDTADLTSPFTVKLTDAVGCAGPAAVCRVDDDIIFVSAQGTLHSLRAVETSADLKASDISAQLDLTPYLQDTVSLARIGHARLMFDETTRLLYYSYTTKTGTFNNEMMIIDLNGQAPRVAFDTRLGLYEGIFMRRESDGSYLPYCGGSGGVVYKAYSSSRSIDGVTAYKGEFATPDTDFGYAFPEISTKQKRFDLLECTVTPTGDYSLTVDIYLDGIYSETVYMDLGGSGGLFGSGTFGSILFGGQTVLTHAAKIHGRGERFAMAARNAAANQDFSVSEFTVHFAPQRGLGER